MNLKDDHKRVKSENVYFIVKYKIHTDIGNIHIKQNDEYIFMHIPKYINFIHNKTIWYWMVIFVSDNLPYQPHAAGFGMCVHATLTVFDLVIVFTHGWLHKY